MAFLKKIISLFTALIVLGGSALVISFLYLSVGNDKDRITTRIPTSGCLIPDINPFDKSIDKYVVKRGKLHCKGKPSITYEDGCTIHINWTVVNSSFSNEFKHCKYQPIFRGLNQSDFHFEFGNLSQPFRHYVKISDEFVKVKCFNKSDAVIYKNFHALIIPKTNDLYNKKLTRHRMQNQPKEIMNVLMIGIDSVSRLNSVRQMPLIRKYLLEALESIEMEGYTKVADNTFVNVVPILTGKFVEELPWNETLKKETFDKYDFIWKNFSQNGYRTLYAEDAPGINAFNYLKKGFQQPPTDHYFRTFSVAMENEKSVWNNYHHCVGDRQETEIVLKYVRDFSTKYHTEPHFGFTFISRLTHDSANAAGATDDPHLRFLQKLSNKDLLNNTVLIYFSDHGMRFGEIRNTYVGKVEERMPFIFFVFPRWFKKKYPIIIKNMVLNSKRLTTPFDLHETLKDILYFKGEIKAYDKGGRAFSLFGEIPRTRTCEDAAILPHWCVCLEREHVPVSSERAQKAANVIFNHINERLSPLRNFCAALKWREIQTAVSMKANDKVLKFKKSVNAVINRKVHFGNRAYAIVNLQLTMVATPGGGIFEATVTFDEKSKTFSLAGDISRINKYGNQSICINDFNLKKYCFCK